MQGTEYGFQSLATTETMRTLGHFKLRTSGWWCPRASRSFRFAQHKIFKCCPRGSGKFSRALVWSLDPAMWRQSSQTLKAGELTSQKSSLLERSFLQTSVPSSCHPASSQLYYGWRFLKSFGSMFVHQPD